MLTVIDCIRDNLASVLSNLADFALFEIDLLVILGDILTGFC